VIVVNRCGNEVAMETKRDSWWHEEVASVPAKHEAKAFDSEHPLFVLYTSGSTGKPKGILHTSGGYLTGTYCDLQIHLRYARRGCLLVHGGCRLDHRTLLHRLRTTRQRRHPGDV
jgi:acyl-coenzyme A synthetase/AMP-(fatty) acid ligase